MTREAGEPILVGNIGSGTYTVGVSVRNGSGRLISTGKVFVTLPAGVDYADDQAMQSAARSLAIQMVEADPGLLTPVRVTGDGNHHEPPARPADEKTPWSAGKSKHRVEKGKGNSKAIMSPDSPEVDI